MYQYTRNIIKTKAMIYIALDILTTTKFMLVLADTGLPGIMSGIDKLRINFFNHVMRGKSDKAGKEMLLKDKLLLRDTSSLELTDDICKRFNIPAVSTNNLHKPLVRNRVKVVDQIKNWISNLLSTATRNVVHWPEHDSSQHQLLQTVQA